MSYFPVAVSCFALLSVPLSMTAQETATPRISTDRPSVGSGPDLVEPSWITVENGIGLQASRTSASLDGSETFLRYGVSKFLELRFAAPNLVTDNSSPGFFSQDGSVTAKIPVPSIKSWPLAFAGGYSIPLASHGQGSGSWDPTLALTTSHSWAGRFTTGATWNRYWTSVPGSERSRSDQAAFDAGWSASRSISTFAEWAPLFSSDPDQAGYTADAGVSWVRHSLQQWDARVGYKRFGSNGVVVGGIGYSFMLPRHLLFHL